MKNIVAPLALATTLATTSHVAYAEKPTNSSQNVCNSNIAVHNAKNRIFTLIQWPETWKNRLTYCNKGKKVFSASAATGSPKSDGGVYTPEWNFQVGALEKNRVSQTYNAPMPNAVHVYKGIFIHAGRTTNKQGGTLEYPSHGCIRLGKADSAKFFNHMQTAKQANQRVEVIIQGTNPKTKKDGK